MARVDELFAEVYNLLRSDLAQRGIQITAREGYRTLAGQAAAVRSRGLYTQGGFAAAPGKSFHNWGFALDVQISPQRWDEFGEVAEGLGLRWGGRFKQPEPWHIDFGSLLSIDEARQIFDRAFLREVR